MPVFKNITLEGMSPSDKRIVKQFFTDQCQLMETLLPKIAQAMLDLQLIS